MRARKRLAALLVAGALSAPMLTPAPASAQLLDLGGLLGGSGALGGLLGGTGGLLGTTGGTGGLTGVLGQGLLNSLLQGSTLLNDCALSLGLLDPATCLSASQLPTTTTTNPFGFGGFPTGFGGFPTGLGGFPQVTTLPARSFVGNQPMVITNNNASNSTSAASATVAPGGGASATATGNSGSTQNQTIVIP